MTTQINAIELNPKLVNMTNEMGLNISKTCEKALKEAIRPLQGFIPENNSVRNTDITRLFYFKTKRIWF